MLCNIIYYAHSYFNIHTTFIRTRFSIFFIWRIYPLRSHFLTHKYFKGFLNLYKFYLVRCENDVITHNKLHDPDC